MLLMKARTGVVLLAVVVGLASCTDSRFQRVRVDVHRGQSLADLIDASVGSYLEEEGMKTFAGVRSGYAVRCKPTGQPQEWLEGDHPSVAIQSTSEGFYVFLSLWDPECSTYGCRETVQSFGPVTRERLVETIADAGCILSEGMEFRLESPPKMFPPMTYDHFLIRFDERGMVSEVIDG